MTRLFDPPADAQTLVLAVVASLLIAWFVAQVVADWPAGGSSPPRRRDDRVERGGPWASAARFGIGLLLTFALVIVPVLEIAGHRPRAGVHLRTLADLDVRVRAFASRDRRARLCADPRVTLLVRRFEHDVNLGTDLDALERAKRARTLGSVVRNVTTALDRRHRDADDPAASSGSTSPRCSPAPASSGSRSASARRRSCATSSAASS